MCQKSAQVAWTDGVVNNAVGYYIDYDPSSIIIVFPTDDMAQRYSREKLDPMIRDTPCLTSKVASKKARDGANTIHSKSFPGGHLELVGSNAPSKLASSPIRTVIIEEPDRCARNSGGEGSAIALAIERSKTFHNRKIIIGGSPAVKGASNIEDEMALSDERHYHIPCPHCGCMQTLKWENVKWDKKPGQNHPVWGDHDPTTAKMECTKCKKRFDNAQKILQLAKGEWRAKRPFNGTAGFYINELYSPFPKATLTNVVEKFLEANALLKRGDPTKMIAFQNTSLGLAYEYKRGEEVKWESLKKRAEPYKLGTVPDDGLILTAGVDTQDDRLAVLVTAWGRGLESWRVWWGELFGDPFQQEVWVQLTNLLNREWLHESGHKLKILSMAIDSGGHRTQAVYNYVRSMGDKRLMAIKGSNQAGAPVLSKPVPQDVTVNGEKIPGGVKLWTLGVYNIKGGLHGRLGLSEGPGALHFPVDLTDDYYKQLTADRLVLEFKDGKAEEVWKSTGPSEAGDCEVYAYAAGCRVGMLTANWDEIEALIKGGPTATMSAGRVRRVRSAGVFG